MDDDPTVPPADDERRARYTAGVNRENRLLEEQVADIRRSEDDGTITVRVAADARIDAMERHLAATKRLRELYLGDSS